MDLTRVPGIGPAYEEKLKEAGIPDAAALARASDLNALAERTGIPHARLVQFQDEAQRLLPGFGEAVQNVAEAVKQAADDVRIVLRERAATARVKIGSIWHDDVPIVTAKLDESEERIKATLRENAVLLKERATTAWVRVNDEWHENIPIFHERVKEGADQVKEEIRVRVHEIRERAPKGEGFLGGIFKKKTN